MAYGSVSGVDRKHGLYFYLREGGEKSIPHF